MFRKLSFAIQAMLSTLGFLFFAPFILLFGILIFLEDGLPIFFIQERIGENKKVFKIYKIRTLKNDSPVTSSHLIEDNSILCIGKIARKFKIDEFPQLLNVIKGDIELVGPRPCLKNQTKLIEERSLLNVFSIKPGVTGLAQVLNFDMKDPKKLAKIDRIFIDNDSVSLKIKILISTFTGIYRKNLMKLVDRNL